MNPEELRMIQALMAKRQGASMVNDLVDRRGPNTPMPQMQNLPYMHRPGAPGPQMQTLPFRGPRPY